MVVRSPEEGGRGRPESKLSPWCVCVRVRVRERERERVRACVRAGACARARACVGGCVRVLCLWMHTYECVCECDGRTVR